MGTDWEAWEPEEPPRDFAERVVATAVRERASRRHVVVARYAAAAIVVIGIAGGSTYALVRGHAEGRGEATASAREEVAIGRRAIAVLEPGAHVTWDGDVVTQSRGEAFYRVAPGGGFRVRTAAAEVKVRGTCFRVKVQDEERSTMNARDMRVGAVGAVIGAATFVGVYEGKVALSHAKGEVELGAGESGRADSTGVRKSGTHASGASGEKSFDANEPAQAASDEDPAMAANRTLADSVHAYKQRLEEIESEKAKLERDLKDAQQKLAVAGDASAAAKKSEFDLTDDDWKQLAKDGKLRLRYPCASADAWNSPKLLKTSGLPPEDGPTVANAMGASFKRTWSVIKPLCAQALGGAADVAEKLGETACITIVTDIQRGKGADVDEDMRQAAEIRAGILPAPPPDAQSPVLKMLLALSYEAKNIESDLTKSLGPEDARRLVYSSEGCWSNMGMDVGPRTPPPGSP